MFIDTHCHLSKEYYEDLDKVINNCKDNQVNTLIISGCDKKGIIEGLEIIKRYSNVYMTIGFHPSEVDTIVDEDFIWLEEIIKSNNKIIGIGEIGLDYYWVKDNKNQQKTLFKKQLEIARKLNLPVVVHSRDAFQDTYDILKEAKVKGIIHCFSGNIENAKKYIDLGFVLGIGGVITFKNTNLKQVIKQIDLKNIVLETDSPYLAPTPYRGKTNNPKYIPIIAEEISNLKELKIEKIAKITSENVKRIFEKITINEID